MFWFWNDWSHGPWKFFLFFVGDFLAGGNHGLEQSWRSKGSSDISIKCSLWLTSLRSKRRGPNNIHFTSASGIFTSDIL